MEAVNGSSLSPQAAKWGLAGVAVAALVWLMFLAAKRESGGHLPDESGSTVEFSHVAFDSVDAAANAPPENWRLWDGRDYLRSKGGETLWLRITLKNPRNGPVDGVLADNAFYVDHAVCHFADDAEGAHWQHLRSGEWLPPSEKALWGREMAFPIAVPGKGERVVYLEMRDFFGVCMKPVWWGERTDFHSARMRRGLAEGGYFGVLLALLLYNAMLWVGTRFPGIGSYLLHLACFFGSIMVARGELPVMGFSLGSPWMEAISLAMLALSGWFLLCFARIFLPLPEEAVFTRRLVLWSGRALLVLAAAALVTRWVPVWYWLGYVLAGIVCAHFVLPWIAIVSRRSGRSLPGYHLLVPGLIFGGLLPFFTLLLPLLPLEEGGFWIMGGSILEMLLLSLLIAARYAGLQQEKIAVQEELLEEGERRKVIQEAYVDELALEVGERTKDLRVSLDDKDRMIAVLGHDLRSPLTGLTRRAEQLAAGGAAKDLERFPSEVAAMGERILLLIEDLVLWGRLRAGTVHLSEISARSLVEPVVSLHREMAVARGLSLEMEIPAEVEFLTDMVLGQTLVRNLLSNALKFAKGKVVVGVTGVSGGARLSVTDDGPGLPAGILEGEGSGGLGLHLCQEIGVALGTRLHAEPAAGGGTVFSFVLAVPERKRLD